MTVEMNTYQFNNATTYPIYIFLQVGSVKGRCTQTLLLLLLGKEVVFDRCLAQEIIFKKDLKENR